MALAASASCGVIKRVLFSPTESASELAYLQKSASAFAANCPIVTTFISFKDKN